MWTLRRWFFTRRSACRDIPELAASEMMAMFWLKEQMSERYTPDTKVQLAAVTSVFIDTCQSTTSHSFEPCWFNSTAGLQQYSLTAYWNWLYARKVVKANKPKGLKLNFISIYLSIHTHTHIYKKKIFYFTFSPSMNLCFSVRLSISTGTSSSERDS